MHKLKQSLTTNQQGLVSILVVMIIMGLITITVVSFALLMRREQRLALDRQLSAQAFYAAESGVNDALTYLKNAANPDITTCGTSLGASINPQLETGADVRYSCVLINKAPDTLQKNPIDVNNSTLMRLETNSGNPLTRVVISWQESQPDPTPVFATNNRHHLPTIGSGDTTQAANATSFPVGGGSILRATFMPITSGTTTTRTNLVRNEQTFFLYPKREAVSGNITSQAYFNPSSPTEAGADGQQRSVQTRFVDGACNAGNSSVNTPRHCNAEISNLGQFNTGLMYIRLRAIYNQANVSIRAYEQTTTGEVQSRLKNYQAQIDATGKANDVLRRIEVRVPLTDQYFWPEYALQSMDTICKVVLLKNGPAQIERPSVLSALGLNLADLDPTAVCQPERP